MEQTPVPDLTVQNVAFLLSCHEETVRQYLRTGELEGYSLGRRGGYRIPVAAFEKFVERRRAAQQAKVGPAPSAEWMATITSPDRLCQTFCAESKDGLLMQIRDSPEFHNS